MTQVVTIGCGIIGATIAYELSLVPGLSLTVLDRQPPVRGATSAALGVLMGAISHKVKGRAWQMRQASLQRYETLIPELEAVTNRKIPFNQQGILKLLFPQPGSGNEEEDLVSWEKLAKIRQSQGFRLEIWDAAEIKSRCPQIDCQNAIAAVYSPQDRQVDPTALTLALIDAAERNGVRFKFGVSVEPFWSNLAPDSNSHEAICDRIQTTAGKIDCDWLIIAAGLGSTQITEFLQAPVEIQPVLGQALQLRSPHPLGHLDFQPVITADDVHIVPLTSPPAPLLQGEGGNSPPFSRGVGGDRYGRLGLPMDYWVGATVEFPPDAKEVIPDSNCLERVRQKAIALCPSLASASIVKTWSGLRPRPTNEPAPIVRPLAGYRNVLLATGHYRNGILLAPATAQAIRDAILAKKKPGEPGF
ncbi:MAG: FAD-binding oxidoreductase [Cyanosarcina radialis HA8281-LM2]|jgi:glycine/D-amino acid oxidase-like deaminating enzyme|nr:FAD-binding oxidoreductase [Cyanosarcina radialis HA8281-LM2]